MTAATRPVTDGFKMDEAEAREFVTANWGKEWPIKLLEEITGWKSYEICRFRKEQPDKTEYDYSEFAPVSVIMKDYGYKRTAARSLIYDSRKKLAKEGRELRTKIHKSPISYQNVIYYNLDDLESVSGSFRDKMFHRGLVTGLRSYTCGDIPHDLSKEEHALFLALIVWHVKYPYGPSPSFRKLGEIIGLSYSSVGIRIRALINRKYIDRKIEMASGNSRGKRVTYRILKAPPLLHDRLIRANHLLVVPHSKN